MLKKSKKSAYIMACIFLLLATGTRIIVEMLSGYATGIYGHVLGYETRGGIMIAFLIYIPILLIGAGVLSLFTYSQNDDHFGKWGAIRWGMAGVIYGLLKVGIDHLISVVGLSGIWKLVEDLLGFLAIVVSYVVVFMMLPQVKKVFEGTKIE